jgi:hypothetical protein
MLKNQVYNLIKFIYFKPILKIIAYIINYYSLQWIKGKLLNKITKN